MSQMCEKKFFSRQALLAYAKFIKILLKRNSIFYTFKLHTNQQYMLKLSIIVILCLRKLKFAHSKAVRIIHIMFFQRCS